nr:MAG TPA: hypothetical protein [Bacteriophage sp.]
MSTKRFTKMKSEFQCHFLDKTITNGLSKEIKFDYAFYFLY